MAKQIRNVAFRGGVLAIGSLSWDEERSAWRKNNLSIAKRILNIPAPIRYGRLSRLRQTYTMVFSTECVPSAQNGMAIFYPFISDLIDLIELDKQAIELIKAERNEPNLVSNKYCWSFGALAFLINPKTVTTRTPEANLLRETWTSKYNGQLVEGDFRVGDEPPIIDSTGKLNFSWPALLDDYDFLVATAIKPELQQYPTPKQIAQKILINGSTDNYLKRNVQEGIKTFQDEVILSHLSNPS